jgi:hypothetical protein
MMRNVIRSYCSSSSNYGPTAPGSMLFCAGSAVPYAEGRAKEGGREMDSTSDQTRNQSESSRYSRGWTKLREIDGSAGERVVASLEDIAPDFARYLIEFPFGDIYSRPQLDLKIAGNRRCSGLDCFGQCAPAAKGAHKWCTQRRLHTRRLWKSLCRCPSMLDFLLH